jgi:hypothetical protein
VITDDDDFIDDEDDAPRGTQALIGVLSVPGTAKSEAEFQALAAGYRAGRPVLFVEYEEATDEIFIGNLAELRAAGFTGQTIAQAEAWLAPCPTHEQLI